MARRNNFPVTFVEDLSEREARKLLNAVLTQKGEPKRLWRWIYILAIILGIILGAHYGL